MDGRPGIVSRMKSWSMVIVYMHGSTLFGVVSTKRTFSCMYFRTSASSGSHLSPHAPSPDAANDADADAGATKVTGAADAAVAAAPAVLLPLTAARVATAASRDADTPEHGAAPMSVPRSTLLDAWRSSARQGKPPHVE